MKKTIGKLAIFILLFICSFGGAYAATEVTASVNKQIVPLNDYLILTVYVSGDNANSATVQIPSMANFSVSSSGRSTSISIINGRISSSVEYSYILTPKYAGKTSIPPISVFTGKEKFFTKEIEITVTSAKSSQAYQSQPSQPQRTSVQPKNRPAKGTPLENLVFVKAETDKKTAYPGEQINLSFKFYTAVPIARNPEYFPPKLYNLFSEDLPPVRTGEQVINGIKYYYSELKTALFAINAGKARIGPIEITAQVQKEEDIDPFDPNFMQKFFSGFTNYEEIKLNTKDMGLEIIPLPENPPSDFSGAVGNFFISREVDRKEVKSGEPLNLTLKITGKGNLKDISVPEFSAEGVKVYDSLSSYSITKHDDIIGGEKKVTYIISFKEEGLKEIPPIKFSFFNIDTKKYETIETSPLKIKVLKGEGGKSYDFSDKPADSGVDIKGSDIKYLLKPSAGLSAKIARKISTAPLYAHLFFCSILIFSFLKNRSVYERLRNPAFYAYKNASSVLQAALKKAQKEASSNPYKSLSLIYDAITDYLTARIGENVYSLPINKIVQLYSSKFKAAEFTLGEIKSLLEEIEFLNYASSGLNEKKVSEVAQRVSTLSEMIEKETKK
ncbi:MAG: protein BatD [Elusimicrobia bacterium]|nr:protein BatD [Elusimicrobiota bacterium]